MNEEENGTTGTGRGDEEMSTIAAAIEGGAGSAAGASAGMDAQGRLTVFFFDNVFQFHGLFPPFE